MILLEVVEAERRKASTSHTDDDDETIVVRHPELLQSTLTHGSKLPDYDTSQAQAGQQDEEELVAKSRKQRKVGKIIVYALVVYFVLSISIAVPLFLTLRRARNSNTSPSEMWVESPGGSLSQPPTPGRLPPYVSDLYAVYGTAIQCNDWTYVPASKSENSSYILQYSLPANETIYLRSNFSEIEDDVILPVTGNLQVSVVNSTSQGNATISVKMGDIGEEALNKANVCLVRLDNGWGLTIYVPDDASEDSYHFDMDLKLPLPVGPPQLTGLATYLPSFNQTFENLDSYANLDSFTVQGSVGSVVVKSVHAQSILVQTSAAEISGTFNGSDRVVLQTVLAPVSANISLYNEGESRQPPTLLNVETGSSDIALNVTLYSKTNGTVGCPPTFTNTLKTFSGILNAAYRHDTSLQTSSLFVCATTSLEPAQVFVDSAYVGTYDVHTTLAEASIDRTEDVIDPTGGHRQRTYIDDLVSPNRLYGWVGWGPRPVGDLDLYPGQGHIEVVSSIGAAVLQLTDAPDASHIASEAAAAVLTQS
ncbi:hypothetical protein M0805_009420 [Coniferiporia weirii]|nr:hypothetical protein M0805_009420 [Coniferiporia weirii]